MANVSTASSCCSGPRPPTRRARGGLASIASTALLILLPKCPYCLVGYAGLLGLGSFATHATMIPTAVLIAFCASQAVYWVTARRTGDRRALVAAALGVTVILASALFDLASAVRWSGVALLVVASTLNAIATTRRVSRIQS